LSSLELIIRDDVRRIRDLKDLLPLPGCERQPPLETIGRPTRPLPINLPGRSLFETAASASLRSDQYQQLLSELQRSIPAAKSDLSDKYQHLSVLKSKEEQCQTISELLVNRIPEYNKHNTAAYYGPLPKIARKLRPNRRLLDELLFLLLPEGSKERGDLLVRLVIYDENIFTARR